jgi:DNA-binding transcriptional LysR family regulator
MGCDCCIGRRGASHSPTPVFACSNSYGRRLIRFPALWNLNQQRHRPFGRLRIHATHIAAAAAIAPVWARFASTYPDVHLEILIESRPIDIVASSFDAGIGRKEWAAADMIAVRVMGPMKVAVVGAPSYFERRRPPRTLDHLASHSCIQYRFAPNEAVLPWSFKIAFLNFFQQRVKQTLDCHSA